MKKLFSDLLLPAAITAILIVLMSASFKADSIITASRNEFISVMSDNHIVQEHTLILDAGHGGADGGAVSITGGKESEINLEIAEKAELLAAFFGINTVMTRDSEYLDYSDSAATIHDKKLYDTNKRVELINSTDSAVVISIHQNYFNDSSVYGAQIFYRPSEDSVALSEHISSNLNIFVQKVRSPKQIADNIYIFKKISCPAILIECGFISNSAENDLLNNEKYQNKTALAIITGYLQYENRLNEAVGGIQYES